MFDRAASQCWQFGAAPVASVAALATLAALLNDAAGGCGGPSGSRDSGASSGSPKAIPGDAHADADRHRSNSTSSTRPRPEPFPTPHWQSLPEEAQLTLTGLMARLILDHADGAGQPQRKEAGHDA